MLAVSPRSFQTYLTLLILVTPDGTVNSGTYGEIIRQNGAPNANRVVQIDVKFLF